MDTQVRLLTKSATWQIMGFLTMTLIGYLFTGSISASGGIAVTGTIIGFVSYFAHEKLWSKVAWGRS
jgi:uncharacterized membrane protein